MAKPADKIEIAFDGTTYTDVTSYVRGYSINRGKSRELDEYRAGTSSVTLSNNDRRFDPTNESSPYYGNILPLKKIRITSKDIVQFLGTIDDWDFTFSPNGDNTATVVSTDQMRIIANQTLPALTNSVELSGARVDNILDEINWPADTRNIDDGAETLGADVVEFGTNALSYLQQVATSEAGSFYIGKDGYATFRDRRVVPSQQSPLLTDDGTGIPYEQLEIVYGSELLYNQVIYENLITGGTAIANALDSQSLYGVQTLQRDNLLISTDIATQDIADALANKYGEPVFRFEGITIRLNDLTSDQQDEILGLELSDVVQIVFRPGSPPTGDPVNEFAEVIGIQTQSDSQFTTVLLKFNTLNGTSLILDDTVFGRLNQNSLAW